MKLRKLIHRLRNENSPIGQVTREIESDPNYELYKSDKKLKDYLNKQMLKKGLHDAYVSLLHTHEMINASPAVNE